MKKILVILICLLWVNSILAQIESHTYSDGDYIDVAVTYDNVTINSGATFTIRNGGILTVNGTLTNNGIIIINEGGQLISHTTKQSIQVEKTLMLSYTDNGWYLISNPVTTSGVASAFSGEAGANYDLYYFKEEEHTWMSYKDHLDNTMFTKYKKGVGFLCAVNENATKLVFNGKMAASSINTPVTCDGSGSLKGFNLIGNPYSHIIYKGWNGNELCSIADATLASGFYKLVNGSWIGYTCTEPIYPCEGILVKATENKNLAIDKTTLEANSENSDVQWKHNNTILVINVSGNSGEDRAYAYFYEGVGLDKIDHISETAPSLSIRYEDADYAIAHVDENSRSLDVIFKNNQSGFFTLSVDTEKANFNYLHLIDNIIGDEVDMLKDNTYKFYSFGNEPDNRFKLVMNPNATTTDDNVFAYVSNGDIVITGLENAATLQVFDVMGRMVSTEVISKAEGVACRTSKPSVTGVYVLRLISEDGIKTQKIVVE